MTDLIPLDAKHEEALMDAVWSALKTDTSDLGKQQRILTAFRAIPTIDPAAIRDAALKEAYDRIGAIVAGYELREDFRAEEIAGRCHDAILALIGEKK